jgi:hypothetical protein
VLVFCVVNKLTYANEIQPAIKRLKFDFFGHDMTVLHSHDIRKPKGDFRILLNPDVRKEFLARLDDVMRPAKFDVIVHIIDKQKLIEKYRRPYDPYNIALRLCLEQLHLFLLEKGQAGRLTHLIAESRGRTEDNQLELEFRRIGDPNHDWGLARKFLIQETPFELRFVEKKINSAGLQLADLVGQPIGRNYLKPHQPNRAFALLKSKVFKGIGSFP